MALSAQEIEDNIDKLPPSVLVGDVGICTTPLPSGLLLPNASFVPPARCATSIFHSFVSLSARESQEVFCSGQKVPNYTAAVETQCIDAGDRAFFPLIGSLATYPLPTFTGAAINTGPVSDPVFGGAFECDQEMQSQIVLDSVPYAESGDFSVNLWFQVLTRLL